MSSQPTLTLQAVYDTAKAGLEHDDFFYGRHDDRIQWMDAFDCISSDLQQFGISDPGEMYTAAEYTRQELLEYLVDLTEGVAEVPEGLEVDQFEDWCVGRALRIGFENRRKAEVLESSLPGLRGIN